MGASKTPESSSQRLTLRLPGRKPSAAVIEDSPQLGVSVDNEALKRQQELVRQARMEKKLILAQHLQLREVCESR